MWIRARRRIGRAASRRERSADGTGHLALHIDEAVGEAGGRDFAVRVLFYGPDVKNDLNRRIGRQMQPDNRSRHGAHKRHRLR